MNSNLSPQCLLCSQLTDASEALVPYTEISCCSQCRLSASERKMNFQQELPALFEKSMTLGLSPSLANDKPISDAPVRPQTPLYNITQHYHHSAHVARPKETISTQELHSMTIETLTYHNIDPSTLSPRQCELYERAMPEQRSRLIQMWQLSPEHQYSTDQSGSQDARMQDHEATNETACMSNSWNVSYGSSSTTENLDTYMPDQDMDHNFTQCAESCMVVGYGFAAQIDSGSSKKRDVAPIIEPTAESLYRLAHDPSYRSQGQRWWEREQLA